MIGAISKGIPSKSLKFSEEFHSILTQALVLSLQLFDLAEDLPGDLAGLREAHLQSFVLVSQLLSLRTRPKAHLELPLHVSILLLEPRHPQEELVIPPQLLVESLPQDETIVL